eukprot:scaffold54879_cov17-Tisochrysis_lutea.AAC.1
MKGPIGAPVGALSDKFSLELWANQACARRVPTYLASWPGIAKPLVIGLNGTEVGEGTLSETAHL